MDSSRKVPFLYSRGPESPSPSELSLRRRLPRVLVVDDNPNTMNLMQDLLARMLANITASQCLIVRQAQLHEEGKLSDAHAALAKAFTTSKCRETVAWAREMLGGNGIVADYKVARFFADCEALYSYEGTFQMQNLIVGKAVTGFSAFI